MTSITNCDLININSSANTLFDERRAKIVEKKLDEFVAEISTNFKRGTTEMLLLSLLTMQDWYVYELSKVLQETSKGLFDIQGPSMYTALYRLQNRGFVSSRTDPIGRRTRIYYHILPDGEEYLKRIIKEYLDVSNGVMEVLSKTG